MRYYTYQAQAITHAHLSRNRIMYTFIVVLVAKGKSAQNPSSEIKSVSFSVSAKDPIWADIKSEHTAAFLAAKNKMDIVSIQPE